MRARAALPVALLIAALPCSGLAQGLLDVAAAGAVAGELGAGGAAAGQRQAGAIRGQVEAALNAGPRLPGAPVEGGGQQVQGGNGGGEQGGGRQGRGGLILYDQLRDDEPEMGDGPAEPVPEQYIVAKGDTLWSISGRFFQNPWFWPKLWSYNEMVTNPHWIYPGDLLSMYPPGHKPEQVRDPAREAEEERKKRQAATQRRISRASVGAPSGLFLRQNGFVEPTELEGAGKIVGSKEEKIMLASLDEVYIEVNPKKPLKLGERYTIYRVLKAVRRPYGNRDTLGNVVEIVGEVQVRQITPGGIARGVIKEALGPIERGYRVGPLRRTYKLVDAKANAVALEGVVVETMQPTAIMGGDLLLFIDLGKDDKLEVGNRLFVIRRGDSYSKTLSLDPVDDRRYPKEIIAEITVVDVRGKTSAGLITRSIREVRVGDRVEARKGY